MEELEKKITDHELECAQRYGEILTKFAEHQGVMSAIKTSVSWNTKVIWVAFASIMAFELNTLFKLVGH